MRVSIASTAVVLAVATASTALAGPVNLQDGPKVRVAQDTEACRVQPSLPWCAGSVQPVSSKNWTLDDVASFEAGVANKFSYDYDPEKPWRSSYDKAASGKSWSGDCDDLVFTTLDGLARAGFPKAQMWRAVVRPAKSVGRVMHMVGIIELNDRFYVVGDTNREAPYPLASAEFSVDLVSQVSTGSLWSRVQVGGGASAR